MTESVKQQSKTKPVLFSLLTLLSGIAIGIGATLIFVKQKPIQPKRGFSGRMLEHLKRELRLTEEQKPVVDSIIQTHTVALDEIFSETRPQISAIVEEMNTEILQVLDDNQKQIWADRMKRMQENFERMRNRGRRGPGGRRGDGRGFGRDPNSPRRRRRPPVEEMAPQGPPPPPRPENPPI